MGGATIVLVWTAVRDIVHARQRTVHLIRVELRHPQILNTVNVVAALSELEVLALLLARSSIELVLFLLVLKLLRDAEVHG